MAKSRSAKAKTRLRELSKVVVPGSGAARDVKKAATLRSLRELLGSAAPASKPKTPSTAKRAKKKK